jgi:hypothetical protein
MINAFRSYRGGSAALRLAGSQPGGLNQARILSRQSVAPAAKVEHGPVIGKIGGDWIEGAKPAPDAKYRLLDLVLVSAEQPVPEDENAAVVLVEILVVDAVMDPMVRGRGEHAVEPAQLADKFGVNPELVEEIDQTDRDEYDRRHAGDRHRQIEDPPEQHARARLP